MIPLPVADRVQPATELVCGDGSEKSLAVVHVDAHLGVGPRCIPRPATDQLTVGDVLRSFEPIHCFDSHLADDRAWQFAQLDVGSGNLHPHLVRPPILQTTRRDVDEGMRAVPTASVGEIRSKQVGLDCGERRAVGVDVDADRGWGITRIPGPAADFLAARLFVAAFVGVRTPCRSRLRITAGETAGKEQEAEADALERRDGPGSLPQAAVTPQLVTRVPATEG